MYWKEDDLEKWADYIDTKVSADTDEGALLVAEKSDNIEVNMMGARSEVAQLLAAAVYYYSRLHEMAFENALTEVSETWSKMRAKKGTAKYGNEVIDMETGFGFDSENETVHLPIPPKELQDEMTAWMQGQEEKLERVKEHLQTEADVWDFLRRCSITSFGATHEDGSDRFFEFEFEGGRYLYYLDEPDRLVYIPEGGGWYEDFLEKYEPFRKVVMELYEESNQ